MNGTRMLVTALCLAISALVPLAGAGGDYVAYALTKKGEFPLPEALDGLEDKHLIQVRWGDFQGPQCRVAVLPVENDSSMGTFQMSGPGGQSFSFGGFNPQGQVPVNGIEAMITDSMARTGRFRLLERSVVSDVMDEQDLAAAGRTTAQSGAETGQIIGAEYLVQAVITSYEPDFKKKKGGFGGLATAVTGGIAGGKSKSLVGMNVRLIDAETSEVVFTKQIDVITTTTEFNLDGSTWGSAGALGGFLSSYSTTPVGQAVMAAVNKGVLELIKQIGSAPVEGSVIKVDGDQVFLNLGENSVATSEVLTASKPGEELIDPETGESLGGDSELVGKLEIVSVKDKYSVAKPLDFSATTLSRGDLVVSTKQAEPLRFAAKWDGPKK